jgi:N-acetylmuramoyl-L-alanine amidase
MTKLGKAAWRRPFVLIICIKRQTLLILLPLVSIGAYNFVAIFAAYSLDLSQKTVAIDPGHGGIDGGTHDRQGLLEKDLNLEVALLLKSWLEEKKIRVVMTRNSDISLEGYSDLQSSRYRRDLDARRDIVNRSAADALISVHVNARPNVPASRGVIVFYYLESEEGKKLAASVTQAIERLVFKRFLKADAARPESAPENFFILREVTVPGCLVELGFITNPEDKKLLQNEEYKKQMAAAMGKGVIDYFKKAGASPLTRAKEALARWQKALSSF